MVNEQRKLLRAAVAIHDTLTRRLEASTRIYLPTDAWSRVEMLVRRVSKARQHGLLLAAARLEQQCLEATKVLSQEAAVVHGELKDAQREPTRVSLHDVYSDLIALRGEFDELQVDPRIHTVSVTTEPIVLEGVDLGRFEIQLDWREIGRRHAADYRVIAREPNPAAVDDSVTHPHVQDESLCEGEGRAAIRRLLEQGHLFDFFMIVANLLRTYNPSSPYVSLSTWNGVECSDCGANVSEDEQWTCEHCSATVCGDCTVNCSSCDDVFCVGCITVCEGCEQSCCADCLRRCAACNARRCRNCLHNNDTCEECHDKISEEAETRKVAEHDCGSGAAQHFGATLQPDGLGEAAVSA